MTEPRHHAAPPAIPGNLPPEVAAMLSRLRTMPPRRHSPPGRKPGDAFHYTESEVIRHIGQAFGLGFLASVGLWHLGTMRRNSTLVFNRKTHSWVGVHHMEAPPACPRAATLLVETPADRTTNTGCERLGLIPADRK